MSFSLRDQFKKRILEDVIGGSKKDQCLGTVLILDSEAAQLLTAALRMPELMQKGVTVVDNIEKVRKAYPSFRGVYLVAPTKANINSIQNDFEKNPLYGALYVYTTRRLNEENFQFLASKSFVKRASAVKEANINFFLRNEFVYELRQKSSSDLQIDGIISVISSLKAVDSLEVCKIAGDRFKDASYLHKFLGPRLKELLPAMQKTGDGFKVKLFLIDRAFDLVTPLMHDFYYESLLTDLMNVDLSNADGKGRELNERDSVFAKFRYMFIKDFLTAVSSDFERFLRENPTAQMQRNKQTQMKLDKMADVVSNIGEYNELIDQYNFHIEKIREIVGRNEKEQAKEVAEAEILLASGVDEQGESQNTDKRLEAARRVVTQASEDFALRLAMVAEGSLYRDCAALKNLLGADAKRIFEQYKALVEAYGKYWPERDKDKLKKLAVDAYNREDSSLKRHIVKAQFFIEEFLKGNRSEFDTLSYGDSKSGGFAQGPNTLFKLNLNTAKGPCKDVVMVYFTSGVSHAEIRALKNMEKKLGNCVVLVGGNTIFTPRLFIEQYVRQ